jgi:hypothetical protein
MGLRRSTTARKVTSWVLSSFILIFQRSHQVSIELRPCWSFLTTKPCLLLESYVTTDGHSASVSWNKAPIWGLWPDFYYCKKFAGLLMWGALSDERRGLSFTIAAGSRKGSHSRVWVPWDSRPYFTVSDSGLPFSLPPTRWVMVEVFDPASTRVVSPLLWPVILIAAARTTYKTPSIIVDTYSHATV